MRVCVGERERVCEREREKVSVSVCLCLHARAHLDTTQFLIIHCIEIPLCDRECEYCLCHVNIIIR